jgi:hypothetical protein
MTRPGEARAIADLGRAIYRYNLARRGRPRSNPRDVDHERSEVETAARWLVAVLDSVEVEAR